MGRIFLVALVVVGFLGCAPNHTLKEVLHNPNLLVPSDEAGSDNPLSPVDQWIQKNLW